MIRYIDGKRIVARAITFIDNKVLLIERYRREGEELLHYFTIPGGGVEDDEEYSETAIRETKEETCSEAVSFTGGYFWAKNVNTALWLGAGSWVWGGRVARSPVPRDRQDSAGKQGLL